PEMTDFHIQRRFRHDNARNLDVIIHEIRSRSRAMVDVIKTVSQIRGYLHLRHPIRKDGKVRVFRVSQISREVCRRAQGHDGDSEGGGGRRAGGSERLGD
ncbi:hypothetical protein U1Q18_004317, partial [Sarracenia purpurea var. burkii]